MFVYVHVRNAHACSLHFLGARNSRWKHHDFYPAFTRVISIVFVCVCCDVVRVIKIIVGGDVDVACSNSVTDKHNTLCC